MWIWRSCWMVYTMLVVGWWGDTADQPLSNPPWSWVVAEGFSYVKCHGFQYHKDGTLVSWGLSDLYDNKNSKFQSLFLGTMADGIISCRKPKASMMNAMSSPAWDPVAKSRGMHKTFCDNELQFGNTLPQLPVKSSRQIQSKIAKNCDKWLLGFHQIRPWAYQKDVAII